MIPKNKIHINKRIFRKAHAKNGLVWAGDCSGIWSGDIRIIEDWTGEDKGCEKWVKIERREVCRYRGRSKEEAGRPWGREETEEETEGRRLLNAPMHLTLRKY